MRCQLSVNLETDHPYWVQASSFLKYFDQHDFQNREVINVTDAYLDSWFETDADGNKRLLLPPVGIYDGRTEFISGRHRTAVLLKHLQRVPLSFNTRVFTEADQKWLNSVVEQKINVNDYVELPTLPIKQVLP